MFAPFNRRSLRGQGRAPTGHLRPEPPLLRDITTAQRPMHVRTAQVPAKWSREAVIRTRFGVAFLMVLGAHGCGRAPPRVTFSMIRGAHGCRRARRGMFDLICTRTWPVRVTNIVRTCVVVMLVPALKVSIGIHRRAWTCIEDNWKGVTRAGCCTRASRGSRRAVRKR